MNNLAMGQYELRGLGGVIPRLAREARGNGGGIPPCGMAGRRESGPLESLLYWDLQTLSLSVRPIAKVFAEFGSEGLFPSHLDRSHTCGSR